MAIDYKGIADKAVRYAKNNNIELDFSKASVERTDWILQQYYEKLSSYEGEEGADTLWNIAVHFGIYVGETMLRQGLKEKGYDWDLDDGMPVLSNKKGSQMSPLTKAHKRILNGPEDSMESFYEVAFTIADGGFPTQQVLRVIDVEMASGKKEENVLRQDVADYIRQVADGEEDFAIFCSHDGFLQFYGLGDQFVAEVRVNLPNNDFRTYSIINREKEAEMQRITLTTPYGQYTPRMCEVISLEQLKEAVSEYYKNMEIAPFLERIPYIETTEEMKRCMGRIE